MTTEERRAELMAIVERDRSLIDHWQDRRTLLDLVREMRAELELLHTNSWSHDQYESISALLAAMEGV